MWIKAQKNVVLAIFALLLTAPLLACNSSNNETFSKENNIDNSKNLIKKGKVLFDEGKNEEAYKIFIKLAEQGDAESQNILGSGYQHGFWGEIDFKQAKYWFQKSADQGFAEGIYNLGSLYFLNDDHKIALPFFEKAAKLNEPNSLNMLGIYYKNGIIFEKNSEKSLDYFRKAAKQRNRDAEFNVGQAYYYGDGVEQDYKQALAWFTKSANQEYSLAKIQLADMYFSGEGVNRDIEKAIEIIKPLAELGDAKAQENLKWYREHPNEY